ncbi:S-adenosyl-L-methionine-dependent tRNA 4-demethylwyosine synthase, partial [Perkinsus olseni]
AFEIVEVTAYSGVKFVKPLDEPEFSYKDYVVLRDVDPTSSAMSVDTVAADADSPMTPVERSPETGNTEETPAEAPAAAAAAGSGRGSKPRRGRRKVGDSAAKTQLVNLLQLIKSLQSQQVNQAKILNQMEAVAVAHENASQQQTKGRASDTSVWISGGPAGRRLIIAVPFVFIVIACHFDKNGFVGLSISPLSWGVQVGGGNASFSRGKDPKTSSYLYEKRRSWAVDWTLAYAVLNCDREIMYSSGEVFPNITTTEKLLGDRCTRERGDRSNARTELVVSMFPISRGVRLKEMITPSIREGLQTKGYQLVGSHSAVKRCRWVLSSLRRHGGCYKHTFYGIESHR